MPATDPERRFSRAPFVIIHLLIVLVLSLTVMSLDPATIGMPAYSWVGIVGVAILAPLVLTPNATRADRITFIVSFIVVSLIVGAFTLLMDVFLSGLDDMD